MSYLYETHLHTSEASLCGGISGAKQARTYKARGYAGIIVTDHFVNGYTACPADLTWEQKMRFFFRGYQAAKEEGDRIGLDVFFGMEYAIHGSEFLVYGLTLEFLLAHPGFDRMTVQAFSKLVRQNGGYLAQAHPYRKASYVRHPYPVAPELLDGLEVFNASLDNKSNQKAFDFAQKHGLAMQAGSDSHYEYLEFESGIVLNKRAETIFDIISDIKKGAVTLISGSGLSALS
jgi:hypothetical protein